MDKKMRHYKNNSRTGLGVAIIGMAGRFPGAKNIDEFWKNLKNGVESIKFFSNEELLEAGVEESTLNRSRYVKSKGVMEDLDCFDESFFNYLPMEAEVMDVQKRILHEVTWEALEDAGYDPFSYDKSIGLYSGSIGNSSWEVLSRFSEANTKIGFMGVKTLSHKVFSPTMVSYKLNLKGPSISLYTACSTSLVTVDLGYRALLTGECDIAVAAGISAGAEVSGYYYMDGMMHSKDGHCRAFDAKASGTVFGYGAGVVVLKRLEEAIADKDNIYAVIISSVVNNDGDRKIGYTAPSVEGQADTIRTAQSLAGIEPESISYIEAHGTATLLGDPIEIEGLKLAFNTDKKGFCRIGSVKSNVGHMDVAAGVTGLIKAALSIKNRVIPPSINFETPNPKIDFENSPFIVNTELTEWKNEKYPLRAGINSYGIGGTNAHVILEEPPQIEISKRVRPWEILLLSAKTEMALDEATKKLVEYLKKNGEINLADVAYTLQVGRKAFKYRRMAVCLDIQDAVDTLSSNDPKKIHSFHTKDVEKSFVFMFPGQGSQYVNMGLDLYQKELIFRQEVDLCFEILQKIVSYDMKEILYPGCNLEDVKVKINETEVTQPILFIFEYALACVLMKWGIKPNAMIGHSIGEYVAACLAGVFSLEDALKIVAMRGKLMQEMPGGSMLSVPIPEKELIPLLNEKISLSAVNSPSLCVVSGTYEAIDEFAKLLKEKGYESRNLHTSHAFHSEMMDPILYRFEEEIRSVKINKIKVPYISNVTGEWVTDEMISDPGYWSKQLRRTVRFSDSIKELLKMEDTIFLEVGPGQVLSTFVRQHMVKDEKSDRVTLNLVRHVKQDVSDLYFLLEKIGQLWLLGSKIGWKAFYAGEKRRRISLPTYSFNKQRYQSHNKAIKNAIERLTSADKNKKKKMEEWIYIPSWKQTMLPVVEENLDFTCYLLFIDELGVGTDILRELERHGNDVIVVRKGAQFSMESTQEYIINPAMKENYDMLFDDLRSQDRLPESIVHLWSVTGKEEEIPGVQENWFYSLVYLAQAIGKKNLTDKFKIFVVSNGIQNVTGDEEIYPDKATALGPVRVIPKEYPGIRCCNIDLNISNIGIEENEELILRLYEEIIRDINEDVIAYRNHIRWVQIFEPVLWEKTTGNDLNLKRGGTYLITGGFGGIGAVLGKHLFENLGANLILIGRTPLLPRDEWEEWLNTHDEDDSLSTKIRYVQELEGLGAEVMVLSADVSDFNRMEEVVIKAKERFGKIDGVIHSAGVADGAMIQRRKQNDSERIFDSKIKGTKVLDRVLKNESLDFFVLCSSVSSILGPFGEVAYTAANSYLDTFAHHHRKNKSRFCVAINWEGWREVGMLVNAAKKRMGKKSASKSQTRKVYHPLFEEYTVTPSGHEIFKNTMNVSKFWVLNEHRIMGNALMVGTGYLEMARAAFENKVDKNRVIELRDVYFINPMVVGEDAAMDVCMNLKKKEDGFEFYFMSRPLSGDKNWKGHARGEVSGVKAEAPKKYDIEEIRTTCNEQKRIIAKENFKPFKGLVGVSKRWNSLREIYFGKDQALAKLELLKDYSDEINTYPLHPALLDISTAFFIRYVKKTKEGYLPFSYKKVTIKKPLVKNIYSFVRLIEEDKSENLTLKFDITIMDEEGNELVDIKEFTVLTVSGDGQKIANEKRETYPLSSFLSDFDSGEQKTSKPNIASTEILRFGLLSSEGAEVFFRIINNRKMPQVIVSSRDFMARIETAKKASELSRSSDVEADEKKSVLKVSRPDLNIPYVAPRNELEQKLTNILQENLGIEKIGIRDDFFEMGGDSIKAINVTSKIRKELNFDVQFAEIFNNPTIETLAKYISEQSEKPKESESLKIEPVEEKEYYPLSSAQKRLYVEQNIIEESTRYNLLGLLEYDIEFPETLTTRIFKMLIERHEILRTSFVLVDDQPVQKVHKLDELDINVDYFDIERKNEEKEQKVQEIIDKFVRPFDMSKAPLIRLGFIRMGKNKTILLSDMNHIISDGGSFNLLTKEILRHYLGKERVYLKLRYKDFAIWQEKKLSSQELSKQKQYWLDRFSGEIPVLEMPTDYNRPALQSFEGDIVEFKIDEALTKELKKIAAELDGTLYMILLATCNILLSKYTGQTDIIVGTPITERRHLDLENVVGMFVNVLLMRNFFEAEMSFLEFFKEVISNTKTAFENQDYQFDDLVAHLGLKRESSRNLLYDVVFAVQKLEVAQLDAPEWRVKSYNFEHNTSKTDLRIGAFDSGDTTDMSITYQTSLFKRTTIEKMAEHYMEIIEQVMKNKDIKLKDIKFSQELIPIKPSSQREKDGEFNL